jgi:hypothetical protein
MTRKQSSFYVLDQDNRAVSVSGENWSFDAAKRTVAKTILDSGVSVSTVFLGLDHGDDKMPQLFESMVFGGEMNGESRRYATWEEAENGHQQLVQELSKA